MDWNNINNNLGNSKEKYSFYFGDYEYPDYANSKLSKDLPRHTLRHHLSNFL